MGYDGDLGSGSVESRLVIALALMAGLLFTTMPITIVGGAFASAWEKKEVIEVALNMQELLLERGLQPRDVEEVFKEFYEDGSGTLDWDEFRHALQVLRARHIAKAEPLPNRYRFLEEGDSRCSTA